jgi:hypothetical protein
MNNKKLWYWVCGVAFLIVFWGLFGHFVCRIGYSAQKIDKMRDTIIFDSLHSEIKPLKAAD